MAAYLAPLFNIATGLSFMLLLAVGTIGRKAILGLNGKISAFGILAVGAGFFCLSRGTAEATLNSAAPMLIAGGGCFFLAAMLAAAALLIRARAEA